MANDEVTGEDLLKKHANLLQREIGIPGDFLEKLWDEPDDWSFVIKLNALVEGAVTHLLTETLGREELRGPFSSLDLAHTKAGKVVFASALGVLESNERRFIRHLAEMRNSFAHDVRTVGLTIPEYLAALKDQKGFLKATAYFANERDTFSLPGRPSIAVIDFCRENPRLAIWFSAMNLIAVIYVHKSSVAEKREAERTFHDILERIVTRIYSATPPTGGTLGSLTGLRRVEEKDEKEVVQAHRRVGCRLGCSIGDLVPPPAGHALCSSAIDTSTRRWPISICRCQMGRRAGDLIS